MKKETQKSPLPTHTLITNSQFTKSTATFETKINDSVPATQEAKTVLGSIELIDDDSYNEDDYSDWLKPRPANSDNSLLNAAGGDMEKVKKAARNIW